MITTAGPKLATLVAATLVALPGCGPDEQKGGALAAGADKPRLTVSAASSLKQALTGYAEGFPGADARLSFAGSDELAAQIRQGVKPDVYAAANTELPKALYDEGLVEKPVVFAANRLVIAVPSDAGEIDSLEDLGRPGVKLAIGARSVPVGSYTREVIGRLDKDKGRRILANVRSEEPDVGGVVGKLTQGAVDAGFVYVTDVAATGGKLEAIDLPDELQPIVAYGAAAVKGARQPEQAKAFVAGLLEGEGAKALRDAGFEPPPSP